VARLAGVSHQTVSRVLNDHPNVRPPTRDKVLAAIRELAYRPNAAARTLVTRRTHTLGVISFDTMLYGPASMLYGFERAAHDSYFVSVASLPALDRRSMLDAVDRFLGQGVEGIVVIATQDTAVAALSHVPAEVPLVAVGCGTRAAVTSVAIDNAAGAFAATRYLLSLGHRTVHHVAGPSSHLDAHERIDGWRRALKEFGAPEPASLVGDWSASSGYELGRELAEWYATVGIRIHEGYGLTETSPVIAVNTPVHHRIGTVGKTLPNIEVRIAEDGEILVRGPSVFKGYWNRPEETKAALVEGWFKTGDIGNIDADGYLSVTDRKKDLIKTSGGKFIAPQPIENSLKLNSFVGVAAILGERRKFPAVMISPNFARLEDWARENDVSFASRADLVANAKVQALYEEIVEGINQNLARFEKLKRVLVVADEFTTDNGVLTPTLKLRRRVVEDRYRDQIDHLYAQAEATPVP
jgi:acyl-CoA synthetase (AMP-forming)/AMP-acid ligase II